MVCRCARGAAQGRAGLQHVAVYGHNQELGGGGSVGSTKGEASGCVAVQCAAALGRSVRLCRGAAVGQWAPLEIEPGQSARLR